MTRRVPLGWSADWPAPCVVEELAAALVCLPVRDVRTYADRLLTRVAVASAVLRHIDPDAHAQWTDTLAAQARASTESFDRAVSRRRRPS